MWETAGIIGTQGASFVFTKYLYNLFTVGLKMINHKKWVKKQMWTRAISARERAAENVEFSLVYINIL